MAEEQLQQALPNSPFPAPPPFWKYFTTTNASSLASISTETSSSVSAKVPIDLTFLRPPPPPPPTSSTYTTFNTTIPLSPTPTPPPSDILLFNPENTPLSRLPSLLVQLTRSVILNFMELTTILAQDPSSYAPKLQDIERLLYNWNYAVNMYRPHQARESVIGLLEGMIEDGEEEMEKCGKWKERVEGFLTEFQHGVETRLAADNLAGGELANRLNKKTDRDTMEEQQARRLWTAIREIEDD